MSELEIKTNNVPRLLLYGFQLNAKEREAFDYLSEEELDFHSFVRYKGNLYDVNEFGSTYGLPNDSSLRAWDGYHADNYFSGVLIRCTVDSDRVVMGQYFC